MPGGRSLVGFSQQLNDKTPSNVYEIYGKKERESANASQLVAKRRFRYRLFRLAYMRGSVSDRKNRVELLYVLGLCVLSWPRLSSDRDNAREKEREREEEEKRDRNEVRVSSRKTRPTSTLSLSPSLSLSLVPFFLPDRNPCRGGFPSSPFRSRLFSDRAAMGIGGNDAETSFDQDSATGSNFVPITGKSIITGFHSIFTNFRLSIRPIFPPILNDGGTVEKQERGKIDALLV